MAISTFGKAEDKSPYGQGCWTRTRVSRNGILGRFAQDIKSLVPPYGGFRQKPIWWTRRTFSVSWPPGGGGIAMPTERYGPDMFASLCAAIAASKARLPGSEPLREYLRLEKPDAWDWVRARQIAATESGLCPRPRRLAWLALRLPFGFKTEPTNPRLEARP